MTGLEKAARTAVVQCMKVKKGESVLVIIDEPKRKIGLLLWEAARKAGAEALLIEILPRTRNGEEPPPAVAELMKHVDVVLAPTSKSLTHTKARRDACKAGARCATLPGIREQSMLRALNADYKEIEKRSKKISAKLMKAKTVRITTKLGTDITMSIKGRKALSDTGMVHKSGEYSNLPAGESFLAPVEGTSEGVIVVDATMGFGLNKKPIRIEVRKGFAEKITGGREATLLKKAISGLGKKARNIAELGIGTNHKAKICGSVLEDEKVMGTIHIAIGDNQSMGGKVSVPSHIDGIITKPTVILDDKIILMKNGKLV